VLAAADQRTEEIDSHSSSKFRSVSTARPAATLLTSTFQRHHNVIITCQ